MSTTRSILGNINNASSLALTSGTVDILANSLSSTSLLPNKAIKTDANSVLISSDLKVSDISDFPVGMVTNPLTSNLACGNFDITGCNNLQATTINNLTPAYNPATTNLNMSNFNINSVNNLNVATVNSKIPMYNPAIANLDMKGLNIINAVPITQLQDKTQFISSSLLTNTTTVDSNLVLNGGNISTMTTLFFNGGASLTSTAGDLKLLSGNLDMNNNDIKSCDNIAATSLGVGSISNVNSLQFSGGGVITSSGSDLKLSSSINFNFNNILNCIQITTLQGQAQYMSTTPLTTNFSGTIKSDTKVETPLIRLGTSPNQYDLPTVHGLNNQYLGSDGTNAIWKVLEQGAYGQIARQTSVETVGYTMVANVLRSATNLGGTTNATFLTSSDVTANAAAGTLTYAGNQRVLSIECSCRVRIADAKQATGLATLYLTINGVSVSNDSNRITDVNTRAFLYCKYIQPINPGSVISFSISYDAAVTTNLFLSSISLSLNGYAMT